MAVNIYAAFPDDGIEPEEQKLYDLINQYRAQNGLSSVPLSSALSLVANRHVHDLTDNVHSTSSMHSWSDAPYDSANPSTYPAMWTAPQRFSTGYTNYGYEIAYWNSGGATASAALQGWQNSSGHNDVILNLNSWQSSTWKAVGVGIYGQYAVFWFGEAVDSTTPSTPPPTNTTQFIGDAANNTLVGNAADNVLDGKAGADTMSGAAGNDTYYVDNTGDVVTETGQSLYDVVYATVSYSLSAKLYKLILTGTTNIDATGNSGNNVLIGNEGNNKLNGAGGIDTLQGGQGDDTYYVYDNSTQVKENPNEGNDSIFTIVNGYVLGANIENLTLHDATYGTTSFVLPINSRPVVSFKGQVAYGNDLNNTLTGNSNNNFLVGGVGQDTLQGGKGDDIYAVDNVADVVQENAGEGNDIVISSVSHTLATNVEHLVLWGGAAIDATGNDLSNGLFGNDANNSLTGGNAGDLLCGGKGQDTINLNETLQSTDVVRVYAGDSLTSSYDLIQDFKLCTGGSTAGVDALDFDSAKIANNIASANGIDAGVIRSHSITKGLISFSSNDVFSSPVTVSSSSNLSDVLNYLKTNIAVGDTVTFTADGNTFVFQGGVVEDTVVELVGVSATGLCNTGLDVGTVAFFSLR